MTHDTSEAKLTIRDVPDRPGVAAEVFSALADENVNVDMIIQNVSEAGTTDISFTVPDEDLARARGDRGHRRGDRRAHVDRRRGGRQGLSGRVPA